MDIAPTYAIRKTTQNDEPALWQMLFYAAQMNREPGRTVHDAMHDKRLSKYVSSWGRDGDLGYIAVTNDENKTLGAAWVRLFPEGEQAYHQADATIPELAVAVLPACTGQGIGTRLMQSLLNDASHRYPAIALNVRANNPAIRLYQRLGFRIIREFTNRVGTTSYDMRREFST